MEIYCRDCGGLIEGDADVMSVTTFKEKYGEICPHCKAPFSDHFNIKKTSINNQEVRK